MRWDEGNNANAAACNVYFHFSYDAPKLPEVLKNCRILAFTRCIMFKWSPLTQYCEIRRQKPFVLFRFVLFWGENRGVCSPLCHIPPEGIGLVGITWCGFEVGDAASLRKQNRHVLPLQMSECLWFSALWMQLVKRLSEYVRIINIIIAIEVKWSIDKLIFMNGQCRI